MNLYNNYMQKKCASQDIFNKFGSGIGRDDALHETVTPFGFEPARTSKRSVPNAAPRCGAVIPSGKDIPRDLQFNEYARQWYKLKKQPQTGEENPWFAAVWDNGCCARPGACRRRAAHARYCRRASCTRRPRTGCCAGRASGSPGSGSGR